MATPSYPNFAGKHAEEALFTAADFTAYLRQAGALADGPAPPSVTWRPVEAAALFAVAQVRGLQLASAFVISDSLADLVWVPRFHEPQVQAGLTGLYQAALTALTAPGGPAAC